MNLTKLNEKFKLRQELEQNLIHSVYFNELWGENDESLIVGCYSVNHRIRNYLPRVIHLTMRKQNGEMKGFKIKYRTFKQLPIKSLTIQLLNDHPKCVKEKDLQFTEITL